jgi:hypothetical protein
MGASRRIAKACVERVGFINTDEGAARPRLTPDYQLATLSETLG